MIWGGALVLFLDLFLQRYFRAINFGYANRGVSFGLGPEMGTVISVLAFGIFMAWYLYDLYRLPHEYVRNDDGVRLPRRDYTPRNDGWRCGLLLIIIGGLGNIMCRVIWGSVWDYVCLPFLPFCFNLSDVLISLGVVSYILGSNGNRSSLRGQRDTGNK